MRSHSEPAIAIERLESGVDWLTVTCRDQEKREALYAECQMIRSRNAANGDAFKKWTFKGYAGYMCGGVRWGTREDSDIGMLSGWDAHQNWYIIGNWAQQCSRLDLAVTVELQRPFPNLAKVYEENLKRVNHKGVAYKGSMIKDSDGGQTLYVQRRTGRAFGRIYDKGREGGDDVPEGKLWRYEIQFQKPIAKSILDQVLANRYIPISARWEDEVGQSILSTVYVWYEARNIPPLFNRLDSSPLSLEVEARVTSDDVSLAWLSNQVRPTVSRLAKRGKLDRVKEALGLTKELDEHLERVLAA
jgi:DNA relaxase NicK